MDTLTQWFPTLHWINILILPGLLIAFTMHELGHSLMAYFLGDTSQIKRGTITANPFKHVSWLGVIFFLVFRFGPAKTIKFETKQFQDKYLDSFLVAVAGPAANLAISLLIFLASAGIFGLLNLTNQISPQQINTIFFFGPDTNLASQPFSQAIDNLTLWIVVFTNRVWTANFILALLNLIPLPGFDGFTALFSLLGMFKRKRLKQLTDPNASALSGATTKIMEPQLPKNKKQSMADIHFKVGTEFHQQKKFDDAIARYRQALKTDSTYGPAYVNLGLAYKAKNQTQEAIQALRGATQYAADETSKTQAWIELHTLSTLPELGISPPLSPTQSGDVPWTDTRPTPNWVNFWVSLLGFILLFSCPIGILLTTLLTG